MFAIKHFLSLSISCSWLRTLLLWGWAVVWSQGAVFSAKAQDSIRYANWRLELAEEFDTDSDSSALAAHWRFSYPWGRYLGGLESEYYIGQEVNIRGGTLRLTAHQLAQPRQLPKEHRQLRYTSGMLYARHSSTDSLRPAPCPPGEGISYGLFEIRCRQPFDSATWPAFWLYGAPDELDIFEGSPSGFSNNVLLHSHDYWRPAPVEQSFCQCAYIWPGPDGFSRQFHTYALEWLPHQLTFYFDGVPIRRETRFRPLGCQMAVIANLAVWAWAGTAKDSLEIDYIRVYRPRQLRQPFGAPVPVPGIFQFPRMVAPELSSPPGEQQWQLWEAAGQLRLALHNNLNPVCGSFLRLPVGSDWHTAWVGGVQAPSLAVAMAAADTTGLRWSILDAAGRQQYAGHRWTGHWPPPEANLAPGAYQVRFELHGAVRYQPWYIIDQPRDSRPESGWQ